MNTTIETAQLPVKIRKGDMVEVVTGKERGKQGKVLQVLAREKRILIEKLNLIKKHQKPNQSNKQGGIVDKEASIHISNVMLICTHCSKATRPATKLLENGKKIRVCKKCGESIDKE
jgi:large subunit ribosomal protein L24